MTCYVNDMLCKQAKWFQMDQHIASHIYLEYVHHNIQQSYNRRYL